MKVVSWFPNQTAQAKLQELIKVLSVVPCHLSVLFIPCFELGKSFLNGIEVRRVWRQIFNDDTSFCAEILEFLELDDAIKL